MKLTDTQTILLSAAANRDDRLIAFPAHLTGAVAATVAKKLIAHQLAEQVLVERDMPHWRQDADSNFISLRVTAAGLAAIGVEDGLEARTTENEPAASQIVEPAPTTMRRVPRRGTKLSTVIALLSRPDGATITDLTAVTDWLPHTVRAVLTRLRQQGHDLTRRDGGDGGSRYRIENATEMAGA